MAIQKECRFRHMAAGLGNWIGLMVGLVFVSVAGAGCGVEQAEQDGKYYEENPDEFIGNEADIGDRKMEEVWRTAPLIEVENPGEENLADWMQQKVSGAMVQINTGKVMGSGVLWQAAEGRLYIATARHVVEDGSEPIEIHFVDGTAVNVTESWLSENADLAFVCVDSSLFREEQLEQYCLVNTDKESFDRLAGGDGIILMASAGGVGRDAYEGKLVDSWVYLEDFGQYMMHIHVYAYEGMSGGGVFDQKGHFIGIFCGENGDMDGAAVPLGILQTEFARMQEM